MCLVDGEMVRDKEALSDVAVEVERQRPVVRCRGARVEHSRNSDTALQEHREVWRRDPQTSGRFKTVRRRDALFQFNRRAKEEVAGRDYEVESQ